MRGPDFRVIGRATPAVGHQQVLPREVFRAHEHLRECRVRHVRGVGAEHQFGIRGDFYFALAQRAVRQGQQAHFGIVFGRYLHLERADDVTVGANDLGAVFGETDFVAARLAGAGLVARGPDTAGLDVAQQ